MIITFGVALTYPHLLYNLYAKIKYIKQCQVLNTMTCVKFNFKAEKYTAFIYLFFTYLFLDKASQTSIPNSSTDKLNLYQNKIAPHRH